MWNGALHINPMEPWSQLTYQLNSRFGINGDHAVTSVVWLLNGLTSREAEILECAAIRVLAELQRELAQPGFRHGHSMTMINQQMGSSKRGEHQDRTVGITFRHPYKGVSGTGMSWRAYRLGDRLGDEFGSRLKAGDSEPKRTRAPQIPMVRAC